MLGAHRSIDCASHCRCGSSRTANGHTASASILREEAICSKNRKDTTVYKPALFCKQTLHTTFLFTGILPQKHTPSLTLCKSALPLTQVQASFSVQCSANSSSLTSSIVPPFPAMSFLERVSRIQSSSPQPGPRLTLLEVLLGDSGPTLLARMRPRGWGWLSGRERTFPVFELAVVDAGMEME